MNVAVIIWYSDHKFSHSIFPNTFLLLRECRVADVVWPYCIHYDCLLFSIFSFGVITFCVVVRTFESICSQIYYTILNRIMTTQVLGIFHCVIIISPRTIIHAFCTTWYILTNCQSIESGHWASTIVPFSFQLASLIFEWNFTMISTFVIKLIFILWALGTQLVRDEVFCRYCSYAISNKSK